CQDPLGNDRRAPSTPHRPAAGGANRQLPGRPRARSLPETSSYPTASRLAALHKYGVAAQHAQQYCCNSALLQCRAEEPLMSSERAKPERGEIDRMLREAGSAHDLAGVTALIAGVLASPPEVGTGWHALVADPMPADLGEALESLRQD